MSRIYFDSMLFVYILEANPEFGVRVREILAGAAKRRDTLLTSVFTIGEVLIGAYKKGDSEAVARIKEMLRPPTVELIPFTAETVERYAQIRAKTRVDSPDAIHLASAAGAGVDLFLTNDRALTKLVIPGIDFIAGLDVNLF